jgi:hypothetical protein
MVKKNKLTKKQLDELQGFEEIMDVVSEERTIADKELKRKEIEKFNDSFELYNFLEHEVNRVKKLDDFFSYKVPNLKNNPQTEELNFRQAEKKKHLKEELKKKIKTPGSAFQKNLKQIFDTVFIK